MRALGLAAVLLLAACSQAEPAPTNTPVTKASCKLPVSWDVNRAGNNAGVDVHAAFVSGPDGAVTEVGVLSGLPYVYGVTYDSTSHKWLGVGRSQVSHDGSQYAYWTGSPSGNEIHVVDVASGSDRIAYSGSALYIVIAFESDAIYLVHAINPRQGAYEKLYRLDPAGGTPTLVPGSDRHLYQYGWVLVSDGAAWGVDYGVDGNAYYYSVVRLDLGSAQVTKWFEGPSDDLVWPLGTDRNHRLYIQGVNVQDVKHGQLWRIAVPGQATQLANPGPIGLGDFIGGSGVFVSDSMGEWFAGQGGVWLYNAAGEPKQFVVGPPDEQVWPAGPCL